MTTKLEIPNSVKVELSSEADSEVIKVLNALVTKPVVGISDALSNICGAIIGDNLAHWRQRCLINNMYKTSQLCKELGFDISNSRQLTNGELYKFIEGASKEDNPRISDLWAGLLANALNPNSDISIDAPFIKILSELTEYDVKIIDFFHSDDENIKQAYKYKEASKEDKQEKLLTYRQEKITQLGLINKEKILASFANLMRLGILNYYFKYKELDIYTQFGEKDITYNIAKKINDMLEIMKVEPHNMQGNLLDKHEVYLSDFGENFVTACYVKNKEDSI